MLDKSIRLGVNIDHIATLRQVRGNTTAYPDLRKAARLAVEGGANLITIHLREDRRHIQDQDVIDLCKDRPAKINLELAASSDVFNLALEHKPDWLCFVPEKREELTTEGGLDVLSQKELYKNLVEKAHANKMKVSMFIEPDDKQVKASHEIGADAIELHTGKWVRLDGDEKLEEWQKLKKAASQAKELKLGVHAGHGLDYQDIELIMDLPHLEELNIGHSIVCHAIFEGLIPVVQKIKDGLKGV